MPRRRKQDAQGRTRAYERACDLAVLGYALSEIAACTNAPTLDTLYRWLAEDGEFRARFERARDVRRQRLADSVVALADDNAVSPRDRRLGMDARKWRLAQMDKDKPGKDAHADAAKDEVIARLRDAERRIEAAARAEAAEAQERAATASGDGNGVKTVVATPKTTAPEPQAAVPEPKIVVPTPKTAAPEPKADAAVTARDAKDAPAKEPPPGDTYTWHIAFPGGGADVTASNSLAGEWWR